MMRFTLILVLALQCYSIRASFSGPLPVDNGHFALLPQNVFAQFFSYLRLSVLFQMSLTNHYVNQRVSSFLEHQEGLNPERYLHRFLTSDHYRQANENDVQLLVANQKELFDDFFGRGTRMYMHTDINGLDRYFIFPALRTMYKKGEGAAIFKNMGGKAIASVGPIYAYFLKTYPNLEKKEISELLVCYWFSKRKASFGELVNILGLYESEPLKVIKNTVETDFVGSEGISKICALTHKIIRKIITDLALIVSCHPLLEQRPYVQDDQA